MARVSGAKKADKFHPTIRRKVVAAADVYLRQVQIVDSEGRIRSMIVWQCGSDAICADTLSALGDPERAKAVPPWMAEQLAALPASSRFNWDGGCYDKKGATPVAKLASSTPGPVSAKSGADDDLPAFTAQ